MTVVTLADLQASVVDKTAFTTLDDYRKICVTFLRFLAETAPTRIVSPTQANYIFYQYGQQQGHKITRPLNSDLFLTTEDVFNSAFERFVTFLGDLKAHQERLEGRGETSQYLASNQVNQIVYTLQQSLGCVADAFPDANQARKRIGILFETLIKLIIREVGLVCEPRTIKVPLPDSAGLVMKYELDVVFSRNKAIITAETKAGTLDTSAPATEPLTPSPATTASFIGEAEIVGSVKTTSKDRIDKVFLDKYLLTKLLGRDIPVVAVFLHDVQRSSSGRSIFGISSTFKSGHFLGYTLALNKLDGVYYVDPRPEMMVSPRLREQIRDFQHFLVHDLWTLSGIDPREGRV